MEFINGNITDITFGIICHQVNCQGVMGAGVALAIRNKWPVVYTVYHEAYGTNYLRLGRVIFVMIDSGLIVANLCGQNRYGRKGIFTEYDALHKAIHYISEVKRKIDKKMDIPIPVYFPNGMGCRLAGGDWNIVIKIIGKYIPDAKIVNYTHSK
jgi:hypothetical protein